MVYHHSLLYTLWIGFTPSHLGGHHGWSLTCTLNIYFTSLSLTHLYLVSVPELFWLKIHTAGKRNFWLFSLSKAVAEETRLWGNICLHQPEIPDRTEWEMGKNPWVHEAGVHLDRNLSGGDLIQWNWREQVSPIRNPSRNPVLGSEMAKQSSSVGH